MPCPHAWHTDEHVCQPSRLHCSMQMLLDTFSTHHDGDKKHREWLDLSPRWLSGAQCVIFLFEHSEQGSAGLILNKPTQYTIGTMAGLEALGPEVSDNGLFLVKLPATFRVDGCRRCSVVALLLGK